MPQSAPDMHRITQAGPHPPRAQTSPSSGAWQPPHGAFEQHPQHFDPSSIRHPSIGHPYDSTDPSSASSTILTPQTPSSGGPGFSSQGPPNTQPPPPHPLTDLTSHGVPDLSAMMFPTSDPFAYPNQPMTTLENSGCVKQEENLSPTDLYPPPDGTISTTAPPFQNFDMQFQMPDYMMQSNHNHNNNNNHNNQIPAGGNWGLPEAPSMMMGANTNANDNMDGSRSAGGGGGGGVVPPWPPQQQQQQQPQQQQQQQRSYDQLFGEDWGGWMNQGYNRM